MGLEQFGTDLPPTAAGPAPPGRFWDELREAFDKIEQFRSKLRCALGLESPVASCTDDDVRSAPAGPGHAGLPDGLERLTDERDAKPPGDTKSPAGLGASLHGIVQGRPGDHYVIGAAPLEQFRDELRSAFAGGRSAASRDIAGRHAAVRLYISLWGPGDCPSCRIGHVTAANHDCCDVCGWDKYV